jgi:hypothetical protein
MEIRNKEPERIATPKPNKHLFRCDKIEAAHQNVVSAVGTLSKIARFTPFSFVTQLTGTIKTQGLILKLRCERIEKDSAKRLLIVANVAFEAIRGIDATKSMYYPSSEGALKVRSNFVEAVVVVGFTFGGARLVLAPEGK